MTKPIDTSPARLRELVNLAPHSNTYTLVACQTLLALADEKEAAQELSMSMFASKEDYERAIAGSVDVPLPEPDIDGTVRDPELRICYTAPVHYTADQMRNYGQACAKAVLSAKRGRIAESIEAEIDADSLDVGDSYYQGMARAAEIAAQLEQAPVTAETEQVVGNNGRPGFYPTNTSPLSLRQLADWLQNNMGLSETADTLRYVADSEESMASNGDPGCSSLCSPYKKCSVTLDGMCPICPTCGSETEKLLVDLVDVLLAYEGGAPTISNQGQSLDGYSALSNFVDIAKRAREALAKPKPAPVLLTEDEKEAVLTDWMYGNGLRHGVWKLVRMTEAAVLKKNGIGGK